MGKVTEGASILGMFIIGALVERWVSISFTPVVSRSRSLLAPISTGPTCPPVLRASSRH